MYRPAFGPSWHAEFAAAVAAAATAGVGPRWDPAAIAGVLGFGFACGDRTMLREVRRQPWMSTLMPGGEARLETIPPHGRRWAEPKRIGPILPPKGTAPGRLRSRASDA